MVKNVINKKTEIEKISKIDESIKLLQKSGAHFIQKSGCVLFLCKDSKILNSRSSNQRK
jgi:hypothetical protein